MHHKLNSLLAILLGLSLLIGETIRRFGEWGFWARWMDDFFMGLWLIIPGIMVLNGKEFGRKLLIGGWGINVGMLYGSYFSKIAPNASKFESNIEPNFLIFLIGLALIVSIAGLIWILILEKKKASA